MKSIFFSEVARASGKNGEAGLDCFTCVRFFLLRYDLAFKSETNIQGWQ